MAFLLSWGRRFFGQSPKDNSNRNWEPDRVTKEEMTTLFARELQRYSKVQS